MPFDSTAVLSPEAPVAEKARPNSTAQPSLTASENARESLIQNAVFEMDRPSDNIRLSLFTLVAITITGFLITVLLVMALNWTLR